MGDGPVRFVSGLHKAKELAFFAEVISAAEAEGLAQTVNFATGDTREAVRAFLDKRPPVFHGR